MSTEGIAATRGGLTVVLLMGWLSVVLLADHDGSLGLQRLLGALTWGVLLLALRRVTPTVRAQTAVVVVVATVVEYVFSPGLEVYVYRFDNVPAYVPPGHGLVYLSAYALGHSAVGAPPPHRRGLGGRRRARAPGRRWRCAVTDPTCSEPSGSCASSAS